MRKNAFFLIATFLLLSITVSIFVFSQASHSNSNMGITEKSLIIFSESYSIKYQVCKEWKNCDPKCSDPKWCYKGDCCESKERVGGVKCMAFNNYEFSGEKTVKLTFLEVDGKIKVRLEIQDKQPVEKTFGNIDELESYLMYDILHLRSTIFFRISLFNNKLKQGQFLGYTRIGLSVIGEEIYNGRKAWAVGLKPYGKYTSPDKRYISKYDGKTLKVYRIAFNEYAEVYFIKINKLKILIDKETGIPLYVEVDFSYYSKEWGDSTISNPSILEDCGNIGEKGEIHYKLETLLQGKRESPGKLCFILEKDLNYAKGKYIVENLAGFKIKIIKDSESKTVELDNCGCVNVTKLCMVDKNGKIIPGKYTLIIESSVSTLKLVKWKWYYGTSHLFPPARISYTIDVSDEGFTLKIDKTINARVTNKRGENIFQKSPLDVTGGGQVKLRTVEAWDKMMRYAVYRFLVSAGVSKQTASDIRDIPVYYGQKVDHFTTLWWNQIKLYHDAATTYTFSSDKPSRLSEILEGIFHEYGHAAREYLWKDPSIVFRHRMLGGSHPSPSLPAKTSWVAFDEGHSDFFAYLAYNYMLHKLYSLLDVPVGQIDDYSGTEYKGSRYLGDVVEGRIAGLLLRVLYSGDEAKAYNLFLSVCNKAKQITGYNNPYYSTTPRPPRNVDEWLTTAYLTLPSKRGAIQKYADEYNMFFTYKLPNAKTGSVSGKLIIVYHLDSILPGFNAWYSPSRKDEHLQALWEYTVWRIEDGSYFDSKDSYNLLFLEDNVFYVPPGARLNFHKDYLEVVKGEIMYQSSKTGKWIKVKAKGYSIIKIKSLCVIKVKDSEVTFTMIDGEIVLSTPKGTIRLKAGKSLVGTSKGYKINNIDVKKEVLKYNVEGMSLLIKNNEIEYGEELHVKIQKVPKGQRLAVYAFNTNTTLAKKIFDNIVSQSSINIKTKLDAGQYIVFAYTYDKNITLAESNAQLVEVKPVKVELVLETSASTIPVGGKIKVRCSTSREIKGVIFHVISPTGNITTIMVKNGGTVFEKEFVLNQEGSWTITVEPADPNIIVEKTSSTVVQVTKGGTILGGFDLTILIVVAIVAIAIIIGILILKKRRQRKYYYPYYYYYYGYGGYQQQ